MNTILVPIMIAVAVMLLAWGIGRIVTVLAAGDERRLKERLSAEESVETEMAERGLVIREQSGLSGALVKIGPLRSLDRKLQQAYPSLSLAQFLGICLGGGLAAFLIAGVLGPLQVAFVLFFIGAYVPVMVVNSRRASRQRAMTMQLPEALDFLCRILRAGHSFSTGLQMMGEELPEPLGGEFRRCHSRHSLGQPLESCLREMTGRIESSDFAFFVTAVMIQRQTGGDLTALLGNIGDTVRQRIRMQQQVKAKTAEGRFSGYILVAFPAVMFVLMYMLNPQYVSIMLTDHTGLTLLGVAVFLQTIGLISIRKITTVKI